MLDMKKTINALLQFARPRVVDSGIITSSQYTIRLQEACVRSGVCTVLLAINRGGSNFASGRTNPLATITERYRPARQVATKVSASTGINNVLNRTSTIIIQTNGNVILDNYDYADVKEILTTLTYVVGGGTA